MLQSEISIQMDEDKERKEWQEHRLKIAQEGKEFIFSQYEVKDVSDLIYFEEKYNSNSLSWTMISAVMTGWISMRETCPFYVTGHFL